MSNINKYNNDYNPDDEWILEPHCYYLNLNMKAITTQCRQGQVQAGTLLKPVNNFIN